MTTTTKRSYKLTMQDMADEYLAENGEGEGEAKAMAAWAIFAQGDGNRP